MKTNFKTIQIGLLFIFLISCQKEQLNPSVLNIDVSSSKTGTNTSNSSKYGTLKDIDGNTYKTIQIGKQVWMAENLRVTKYRNGDAIPNLTNNDTWNNTTSGAWCFYGNQAYLNPVYGKLYNWHAIADSRGLAPRGWHVPTLNEVNTLVNFLGGPLVAGGALKETGLNYWVAPNAEATNSSGFSARPGGNRNLNGFYSINSEAEFWTADVYNNYSATVYAVYFITGSTATGPFTFDQGASIRCIKD